MCLYSKDKTPTQVTEGYKVFKKSQGKYYTFFHYSYDMSIGKEYDKDCFYTTKTDTIDTTETLEEYILGFHFFPNLEDAREYIRYFHKRTGHSNQFTIIKIKTEDILATGTQDISLNNPNNGDSQDLRKAAVARKITLLEEIQK